MQKHIQAWISTLDAKGIVLIAILGVALLGLLDGITYTELSFSFFFLLPIALVAWYVNFRTGIYLTLLSLTTWAVINYFTGQPYTFEWMRYFNISVRLVAFSTFTYLVSELKTALEKEKLLAKIDVLTGALNRREFISLLEVEIQRAARLKYPVSFAYLDLDNFKSLNDTQGHSAGDACLKNIADAISKTIRKTDLFARLGGDEFGLFLPNTDKKSAEYVIQKIINSVEILHTPITLSIGIITYGPKSTIKVNTMLNEADHLMYESKKAGKRRAFFRNA